MPLAANPALFGDMLQGCELWFLPRTGCPGYHSSVHQEAFYFPENELQGLRAWPFAYQSQRNITMR